MKQALEEVFRENLKFYRQKAKISQEKLSGMLDKNINYIATIECGKSVPPLSVIEQIAEILGIEPHYFFEPMEESEAFDKKNFVQEAAKQISEQTEIILSNLMKNF